MFCLNVSTPSPQCKFSFVLWRLCFIFYCKPCAVVLVNLATCETKSVNHACTTYYINLITRPLLDTHSWTLKIKIFLTLSLCSFHSFSSAKMCFNSHALYHTHIDPMNHAAYPSIKRSTGTNCHDEFPEFILFV